MGWKRGKLSRAVVFVKAWGDGMRGGVVVVCGVGEGKDGRLEGFVLGGSELDRQEKS
jgi:hypothetical protein